MDKNTVYVKSFEGEKFHGFCGFIKTAKVLRRNIRMKNRCVEHGFQIMQPRKFSHVTFQIMQPRNFSPSKLSTYTV